VPRPAKQRIVGLCLRIAAKESRAGRRAQTMRIIERHYGGAPDRCGPRAAQRRQQKHNQPPAQALRRHHILLPPVRQSGRKHGLRSCWSKDSPLSLAHPHENRMNNQSSACDGLFICALAPGLTTSLHPFYNDGACMTLVKLILTYPMQHSRSHQGLRMVEMR